LFHYLYLALPGMALCVGALAEWLRGRGRVVVTGALAAYVGVSAATLLVVLGHVERTGEYPALGKPLGLNMAAADAARSLVSPGGTVLIGGYPFEVEVLRFGVGYASAPQIFDDCGAIPPAGPRDVYLLNSEKTPAAGALAGAGAAVLARLERPNGDAFVIMGPPRSVPAAVSADPPACRERFR
jgi:hypothetical protein